MARVTLKTIAKEAGVSVSTVSVALRGQGRLDPQTVARVREVADALGYRPDPMLASLASRRFRSGEAAQGLSLALIEFPVFEGDNETRANQYRDALQAHAKQLGYAPYVYPLEEIERYEDITRLLYHRGTVAAIITGQPKLAIFKEPERWESFAIAQCGRYRNVLPSHTVRPNIFQAIQLSFEQAWNRGYRRIGFALGKHPDVLDDDLARFGAALAFLYHRSSVEDRIVPYFGDIDDDRAIIRWTREHRPDCVVSFSTGTWYHLRDEGFRIPDDIGFISLHLQKAEKHPNQIAGLNQARDEIARQTLFLIDQMVRHNERGIPDAPRNLLIQSEWVEGSSLLPPQPTEAAD